MHTQLKKDDASLQKKSSDRYQESRSHVDRNSDLLSGETTEGFTSSPSPPGQGQLVMQCKGLSETPEPTRISGPLIQRRVNNMGLPDGLKGGVENLSGYSMDDVRVHSTLNRPWQTIQTGDDVHAAAASGIAGSGGTLPHFDTIQRAFGGHNVSGIRAHMGSKAAEACESMHAEAYATAGQVAFKSSPTLHTAAHEAAHIIQQRGGVALKGGVGQVNDSYEQRADAVADAVVAGRSAESLLGPVKSSGGPGAAVQHRAVQFFKGLERKDVKTERFVTKDDDIGLALAEGSASSAADRAFEENAQKFEDNLGEMAVNHGSAKKAAGLLSERVNEILVKWATALRIAGINRQAQDKMVNEVLKNILGTAKKTVAGAVGKNAANITDVITGGNLRERMTVLFNFSQFHKEFLKDSNLGARALFIRELGESKLRQRLQRLKTGDRLVSDSKEGEVGNQANTRGDVGGQTIIGLIPDDYDISQRTVGEARAQGVELSDRELETMGLKTRDEFDSNEDFESQRLTWSEGNRRWLINEMNDWVKKARDASLPLKAGPSGTTDRLMQLRKMLGVSTPIDTRAACIGYLLPISAHSLIEILEAASLHRCPKPVYGPKVYGEIDPFTEEQLKRCAPDEDFWEAVKP